MIPKRRPYAPAASTVIPTPSQTEYLSAISTPPPTPEYPSAPSPTSPPPPNSYLYPAAGQTLPTSASEEYPTSSSTSTAAPVAHLEISTPSQGAIIAISVICGLLLIALLFVLLVFIGKRHERESIRLDIGGAESGGGSHHRRKRRSEKSWTEFGDDPWNIGRRRPMDPAILRGMGVPPRPAVDPRIQSFPRAAQPPWEMEDVDRVEEFSEVSSTRAEGTRTSKSGSERGQRSSKGSRSHRKHHRGA
jgi:hypothetical protein